MRLWHVGAPNIKRWDLKHVGQGEGWKRPLGDGIYFASTLEVASVYAKYVTDPWIYEVEVPENRIYDNAKGLPRDLRDIVVEHGARAPLSKTSITWLLETKGPRWLAQQGISGQRGTLGRGFEVSIWEPSVIRTISAKPFNQKLSSRCAAGQGLVYHYTTFEGAGGILKSGVIKPTTNFQKSHQKRGLEPGVSFSRRSDLRRYGPVRLAFDLEAIRHNHKVQPFEFGNATRENHPTHTNAEEYVQGTFRGVSKALRGVDILQGRAYQRSDGERWVEVYRGLTQVPVRVHTARVSPPAHRLSQRAAFVSRAKESLRSASTVEVKESFASSWLVVHLTSKFLGEDAKFRARPPRHPYEDQYGYVIEDTETNRISVAPSIKDAVTGLGARSADGYHVYAAGPNGRGIQVKDPVRWWRTCPSTEWNPWGPSFDWTEYAFAMGLELDDDQAREDAVNLCVPDAKETNEKWLMRDTRMVWVGLYQNGKLRLSQAHLDRLLDEELKLSPGERDKLLKRVST